VNTWHLTGWKLQAGKKVRWEVWGRRAPFFYLERIGEHITIDDGKTQTRILPADRRFMREKPIMLRMYSRPLPLSRDVQYVKGSKQRERFVSPESFLMDGKNDIGGFSVVNRDADSWTLERETGISLGANLEHLSRRVVVDANSKLPTTLTLHIKRTINPNAPPHVKTAPAREFDRAELSAAYDVALQDSITQIPEGALEFDLTAPTDSVPTENAVTKRGLTVQATQITRDEDGNLRVVFGAWLGQTRLNYRESGLGIEIWPEPMQKGVYANRKPTPVEHSVVDENGRPYVLIDNPPRTHYPDRPELYFAPLEPLPANAPLPRTLTMKSKAILEATEYNEETGYGQDVAIVEEPTTFVFTLPTQTVSLGYEEITPDDCLAPNAHRWTLQEHAAEKRALYYFSLAYQSPKMMARARSWREKSLRLAQKTGNRLLEDISRKSLEGLDKMEARIQKSAKRAGKVWQ
jgi:hypothetical protein